MELHYKNQLSIKKVSSKSIHPVRSYKAHIKITVELRSKRRREHEEVKNKIVCPNPKLSKLYTTRINSVI